MPVVRKPETPDLIDSISRLKWATACLQCMSLVRGSEIPPEAVAFVFSAISDEVASMESLLIKQNEDYRTAVSEKIPFTRSAIPGNILDDDRVVGLPDDIYRVFIEIQALRKVDGSLPPDEIIASWLRRTVYDTKTALAYLRNNGLLSTLAAHN